MSAVRQTLPHNPDAEASVLSAVFLRPTCLADLKLEPDAFFDPRHRRIFVAMRAIAARGGAIDTLTVADEIDHRDHKQPSGQLAAVGGLSFLADVVAAAPTADNVAHYVDIVRRAQAERDVLNVAADLLNDLRSEKIALDAAPDVAITRFRALKERTGITDLPPRAADAALKHFAEPLPPAIPTGLEPLDRAVRGLRAGNVSVISAPPGRGKSGFATQIGNHIALSRPVVYVSTELDERQVEARFAAQRMGRPWLDVYELGPSEAAWVSHHLKPLNLRVIRRPQDMLRTLEAVADAEGVAPVFILDYLQDAARRLDLDDARRAANRIMDTTRRWSGDTGGHSFLISSVSRAQYGGSGDKSAREVLGVAKESGDIEFDASLVLVLDVDLDTESPSGNPTRLHVPKHRFGRDGMTIGLRFRGSFGLFEDDPTAVLTDEQREVYELIEKGASSAEEVAARLKRRKEEILEIIRVLKARRVIEQVNRRGGLRVVGSGVQ